VRVAELIALAFLLAIAYRLIAWRLPRREKP
jgi:hypothetical protein